MNPNQIREAREPNNSHDRFIYFVELPSLQEIASNKVALAIRYSHYGYYTENYNYDEASEILNTPPLIQNMIKISIQKVSKELKSWKNHFEHMFGRPRLTYATPVDPHWCVWLPNGEIDYLKTGTKILKIGELNELQKFIVLCEYCMEDELRNISLDALPIDFIANTSYYNDEIVFYWICYLKNELHKIPLSIYTSVDEVMTRSFISSGSIAGEYFWHRLTEDDQFTIVSELISNEHDDSLIYSVMERCISAMSWNHQRRLLAEKFMEILIDFSLHSRSTRFVLWVWKNCKNQLSDEQFAVVVHEILEQWDEDFDDGNPYCLALIEIWEIANYRQRKFVSQTKSNRVVDMCLFKCQPTENTLEFLRRFIPLMHADARKEMIFGKIHLIRRNFGDLDTLNEIIELCLPHPNDKSIFIKSIVDSDEMRRHFTDHINHGRIEELNLFFEYYFPRDIETARTIKRKFLKSITFEKYLCGDCFWKIDVWHQLRKFIDESFLNDEELNKIKHAFALSFGEHLKTPHNWGCEKIFDGSYFQQIISWCLGDDVTAILEFKKHVSHNIIFNIVFYQLNKSYNLTQYFSWVENLLDPLNTYLKWYLTSEDRVKIYKLSKLSTYSKQMEIFRLVSERKDRQFLGILLKWFFDGDDAQIWKFEAENFKF